MRVILILMLLLGGCKSVEVLEATKTKVMAGNQMGKSHTNYEIVVSASQDFSVISLSLNNDKTLKYYYKDLQTGLSSYDVPALYKAGSYSFHFKKEGVQNFSDKEKLSLQYEIDGKKHNVQVNINPKEATKNSR